MNLRSPSGRQIYSLVALTTHPPLRVCGVYHTPQRDPVIRAKGVNRELKSSPLESPRGESNP